MNLITRLAILTSFFFSPYVLSANLKLVDSMDHTPVVFAHVMFGEGKLAATSSLEGSVDVEKLIHLVSQSEQELTIQHVGYENYKCTLSELSKTDTLYLVKRELTLPEVVVNVQKQDYLKLTGYFRSYQQNDGVPVYFSDGFVEYYIKLNGKSLKNRLLTHASYRNKEQLKVEDKRFPIVKIVGVGIPRITLNTLLKELDSSYQVTAEGQGLVFTKQDSVVGFVKPSPGSESVMMYIDKIAPEKEELNSFLNYRMKVESIDVTENYQKRPTEELTKGDLLTQKVYEKNGFKHKKHASFLEMECYVEFYVTQREYISKADLKGKKLSSDFSITKSSSTTADYRDQLKEHNIPPISDQIANQFGKLLMQY